MKRNLLITTLTLLVMAGCTKNPRTEWAIISGRVTDFDGRPIAGVAVGWQNPTFDGCFTALTDSAGRYCARIPRGRYHNMGGIAMNEYPIAGSTLPEADQRLEYWHWNFLADRDTTYDFRYHRLEVYGINAFQIQGAAPGYTVYFRPMSLTRHQRWNRAGSPAGCAALAPSPDSARIAVTIDGEAVTVRMVQQVREYFDADSWTNAYLLFVDRPSCAAPVKTFRIVMEDLGTGDKGEGAFTLEEKSGADYLRPEGDNNANYTE